jgi:predicted PurR-regulated permease PerM
VYVRVILRLIPLSRRDRVQEVLYETGHMLWRWLVGRLLAMLVVGVLTTLGLWLIGVPLAPALGLLAALGEFVPNIGPFLAFVPAVLLAMTESVTRGLAVVLLYLILQVFESYVLTPLVEKHSIELPPALTIAVQVLLGVLLGAVGLALAVPLAAVAMVFLQRLYVEDTLGDSMAVTPSQSVKQPLPGDEGSTSA